MTKLLLIVALAALLWYLLRRSTSEPKVTPRIGEAEARAVLGVDAGADADAIRAAHRRLIGAVHPDKGGSAELTRRVNAARDTLLKRH